MPRKPNGFGVQSIGFKDFKDFSLIGTNPPIGSYPSNRHFGSTVHRTIIQQWNIDSSWAKWRRGLAIFNSAYWSTLKVKNTSYDPGQTKGGSNVPFVPASIASTLYTGTPYSIDMTFSGNEFPTMNADGNTYYVVKRTPQYAPLGVVSSIDKEIYDSEGKYTTNYLNKEIHVTITPNATYSRLLLSLIGDRLTDGALDTASRTDATLKEVLTSDSKPSVYIGKTLTKDLAKSSNNFTHKPTKVTVTIPVANVNVSTNTGTFIPNQGINSNAVTTPASLDILNNPSLLIGKIIQLQDFFRDKAISSLGTYAWSSASTQDDVKYIEFSFEETETSQTLSGLDPGVNNLPPSMLDLSTIPTIFTTTNAQYKIEGSYVFDKSKYQSFFGSQYFTSQTLNSQVQDITYSILPFTIEKADIINNEFIITAVPYFSTIKVYPQLTSGTKLIFSDNSFASLNISGSLTRVNVDVNPWLDEVFTTGLPLRPAVTFTCSCPSYSKSQMAMPQAYESDSERKLNRQQRYPLPSSQGPDEFDEIGANLVAGKVASWASEEYQLSYKICKHTIAALRIHNYSVIEPNDYSTTDRRKDFSDKLNQDMSNALDVYNKSYKRSGISVSEVVFSLSQGLNLDTIETAYVVLNSTQRSN
tara:strand:- start:2295 stop:4217 length:1923 start_codon:yes stop_codon:yes gene_type:complete